MSGFRHCLLWMLLLLGGVHAETPLPASPSPNYIRDDAKWLSPTAFQSLNEKLKAHERETSSQFVVAIFPRIPEGAELFEFSQRLFETWKPGQKGKDNGAIFLIFAEDRKMRIHTGRGMEGVLPDARCKQIIQDIVAPKLRAGNREAAISAGVEAMIAAAKGEYKGDGTTKLDADSGFLSFVTFIFYIIAFLLIVFVLKVLGSGGRRVKYYSAGGWSYTGGSSWGSGSGGGFSGGGGGGFSGGGGGSGGGGASGSW